MSDVSRATWRELAPVPLAGGLVLLAALAGWAATRAPAPVRVDRPREHLPPRPVPFDHGPFFERPFADGPAVTRACLSCHPGAAGEVRATSHWTWGGQEVVLPGGTAPEPIGKRNLLNNFCIGVQSNWPRCTSCHVGYGWRDDGFLAGATDEQVDCLVCHASPALYRKDPAGAGLPAEDVDLLAAARSVGPTTRSHCGACHFAGGGGDAVKHGDLDGSMHFPSARIDVHMGRHDLRCTDCHQSERHRLRGRILPLAEEPATRVACGDCHAAAPHQDERLDRHLAAVACQTCHVPRMAVDHATKMRWDWSQAGRDPAAVAAEDPAVREDPHLYDKKKGRFSYARGVPPEYRWYDGTAERLLPGQVVDPAAGPVAINRPRGAIGSARSRIYPFKVHRGRQPWDPERGALVVPKTYGPGGYWSDFDWEQALRLGAEASGFPWSGRYGFVETEMVYPIHHMVQPAERALGCDDCHGPAGRLDWAALGYPGDPARHGGRARLGLLREEAR